MAFDVGGNSSNPDEDDKCNNNENDRYPIPQFKK